MMSLNDIMEFDHIIEVLPDGTIVDGHTELWAPNLFDDELDDKRWSLLNGYSGQSGYSGPIMHNSEFIGGAMEQDILARPGYYVAVVSYYDSDDPDQELYVEGWAVAYLESD